MQRILCTLLGSISETFDQSHRILSTQPQSGCQEIPIMGCLGASHYQLSSSVCLHIFDDVLPLHAIHVRAKAILSSPRRAFTFVDHHTGLCLVYPVTKNHNVFGAWEVVASICSGFCKETASPGFISVLQSTRMDWWLFRRQLPEETFQAMVGSEQQAPPWK